jgi:hypothetical protein
MIGFGVQTIGRGSAPPFRIEALGVTLMPSMKFTFTIESLFDIRTKVRNTNLNNAEPRQMSIPSTTRLLNSASPTLSRSEAGQRAPLIETLD